MVDAEWVITSYLAANAIILPISGWISAHLGRRNYFLLSIAVFTLASGLCGMATSLEQIILFRVLQGLAGGGLQPSSQGVLLDSFPPEKQGAAMTLFGVAALIGPVVGPTLGGYLTDYYNWRWIFYINIPIGCHRLAGVVFSAGRSSLSEGAAGGTGRKPLNFDTIGLGLLAICLSCWEVVLSKGQQWDWFGDPTWRVQTLVFGFVVSLGLLIFRELRIANPVVDFRPLAERNLAMTSIIIFCAYGVLYAASTSLPGLLQSLFGYDAFSSGLVMSPSGLGSICMLIVGGTLLGRGVDARWMIAVGVDHLRDCQLLDGDDESGNQSLASRLAAGDADRGFGPAVCAGQRGRLHVHAPAFARGGGGAVQPAAQRRGKRGDFDGPNVSGATRPIPHAPRGGVSRSVQSGRQCATSRRPRLFFSSKPAIRRYRNKWPCSRWKICAHQQAGSLAYFDIFAAAAVLSRAWWCWCSS